MNFVLTCFNSKLSPRGRRDDMPPPMAVRLAADQQLTFLTHPVDSQRMLTTLVLQVCWTSLRRTKIHAARVEPAAEAGRLGRCPLTDGRRRHRQLSICCPRPTSAANPPHAAAAAGIYTNFRTFLCKKCVVWYYVVNRNVYRSRSCCNKIAASK